MVGKVLKVYLNLRLVSLLNNLENSKMKFGENNMLKIIIIVISYRLNSFTTDTTILNGDGKNIISNVKYNSFFDFDFFNFFDQCGN
jgi:hypothetical protein